MFSFRLPATLDTNALRRALLARRASGLPVVDLTATNPTSVGFAYDETLLAPLASREALTYEPEAAGRVDAREAVAREYARRGTPVAADRIVLTASTSEAYSYLFKLLCDPGDDVLVPQPSYPLFEWLTRLEGVEARPYRLEYHGRWTIDAASIAAAITPRTKAILIVSPNNPTGSYVTRRELDALEDVLKDVARGVSRMPDGAGMPGRPDIPIIGDEVFWDFALPGAPADRASVLECERRLVFSLGGLSKSAGLPQVKLGWIAMSGDARVVADAREKLELIADTYLSVSTPVQVAAAPLIESGARIREQILARVSRNVESLRRIAADRPALSVLTTEGGWSAVVRVPATRSEESLVLALLEEDGVLVHPGYFFDFAHEAYIVVSLIVPPADFDRGVAAIAARF